MAVTSGTVTSFFDESGKFKDHKVVSFGGVVAYNEYFQPFAVEWGKLLFRNGLTRGLSAKEVLRHHRPLSRKNDRTGIQERIEDLLPFIACIRKYLQVIIGVTIDVRAFKKLPSHFFQSYGNDPVFVAFARTMVEVIEFTPDNDRISFVCDDEEEMAWHMFRLYRRVKKVLPRAKKMSAITFGDDKFFFGLQAADLVSSIMRLEAGRRMLRKPYDYRPLFQEISKGPQKDEELWNVLIAFGNKRMLQDTADSLDRERKRAQT